MCCQIKLHPDDFKQQEPPSMVEVIIMQAKKTGPASTVGERPLRNISSEGTAVRSPLKEASFQTRINSRELDSQKCLTEILYQTGSSSTQPRSREAVAAEHCMKGM